MRSIEADPIPSDDLCRQIESAHVEFTAERLGGIADLPGNPFDVRIARFDRCVALTGDLPMPWVNTIHVIGPPDLPALRERMAGYEAVGRRPAVEVLPADMNPELGAALADLGLVQQWFHAAVCGPARPVDESPGESRVGVCRVTRESFDSFLDVALAGFGAPDAARQNMFHWIDRRNWCLYLATVDEAPAAAAVLSTHKGMGYLAFAVTLPAFRSRGCHTALIRRRIADAHELGCRAIIGQCGYGSASHRNMHRAGLRLAYTKAIWGRRMPPPALPS